MKRIIITGASGLVATELTIQLLNETDACLYLLSTQPEQIQNRYNNNSERVFCFTLSSFAQYVEQNRDKVSFDTCIHTAFSRSTNGDLIAESLNYQQELLSILKKTNLKVFANISSQSVYGTMSEPLWTESTPVEPNYLYAMGKYSSEIITKLMLEGSDIKWTNIRLASIASNANFLKIFINKMLAKNPIILTTPNRTCSFLDIRDAVSGLMAMIYNIDKITLYQYNLGSNIELSINEIAEAVVNVGYNIFDLEKVEIQINDDGNSARVGMDSSLFQNTFNWQPKYSIEDMLVPIFRSLLK